jgi:nitroreductase
MITNEITKTIHERRSTRAFQSRQIDDEQLETILEAATWAPSGSNSQSWLFTAIQNEDVLAKINELLREGFQTWIPDDDYPGKQAMKQYAQKEDCNFFYRAQTLIIASNKPNYENAMADCSLALQNIFLTAHSLGLGSCYINQLHWLRDDAGLRSYLAELGIPKGHTICSSVALGFIAKESVAGPRKDGCTQVIR